MARNSINVNFNLRDPKAAGETPVNAIIRYNGAKFTYSTAEKINPKDWQDDKTKKNYQRAKTSFLLQVEFNLRLNNIKNTIENIFRKYINDNNHETPSWNKLKPLLDITFKRTEETPKGFIEFIEKFIENSKEQLNTANGKQISNRTIQKYKTTLVHLKEFISKKRKKLDFEDIDESFYLEYMTFLKNSYDLATNSIGKDITVVKRFMNAATNAGVNNNLTFKMGVFKSISEQSDSIYLTDDELTAMYNLDLSGNERLEKVRDLFLIGAYTGLRYSDYSALNAENIIGKHIQIEVYKTGQPLTIPKRDEVVSIFKKYDYSLPKSPSNQKTNKYLKEIGKMIPELNVTYKKKITKGGERITTIFKKYELISTHTARRSFATNLYKEGLPSITIMRITGHRTESAFLRYIKITPEDAANQLAEHFELAKRKKKEAALSEPN